MFKRLEAVGGVGAKSSSVAMYVKQRKALQQSNGWRTVLSYVFQCDLIQNLQLCRIQTKGKIPETPDLCVSCVVWISALPTLQNQNRN